MANLPTSLIPLFSNLDYDTLPSLHADHPSNESVDVLKSNFWLCANSRRELCRTQNLARQVEGRV